MASEERIERRLEEALEMAEAAGNREAVWGLEYRLMEHRDPRYRVRQIDGES